MALRKRFSFLVAGLLVSALLAGCGSSSTNTTIPASATIFYDHSVVFRNNSTMTTGYNGFGQLGNGTLNTQAAMAIVPGLGHMNKLAAGGDHTLVLAFSNVSSVFGFGSNYHGQIGNTIATVGAAAYSSTPVKIKLPGIVKDVAAGLSHSLAVVDDSASPGGFVGSVYAWGYNGYGQLGDGTFADNALPVKVKVAGIGTPLNQVTQVAANGAHSLALTALTVLPGGGTSGGNVYAWGNNAYGQLGKDPLQVNGAFFNSAELVQVTTGTVTAPLANVIQIATGGSTSYALKNDGTVWAWGYNGMGQLGLDPAVAANASSFNPVQVVIPAAVLNGAKVRQISAGLDHVLALLDDPSGSVVGWGFNGSGQVGNGNNSITTVGTVTTDNTHIFVPAKVVITLPGATIATPLTGVTDITAFGTHSLALVGKVLYGWGYNGFGQLGNPISTTSIAYLLNPTVVQGY